MNVVPSHLRPTGAPGSTEQYNVGMVGTHGLETSHVDTFSSSISREGTLMIREVSWYKNHIGKMHFLSGFYIRAFTENAYSVYFKHEEWGGEACAFKWLSDFNCSPPFLYPSKLL